MLAVVLTFSIFCLLFTLMYLVPFCLCMAPFPLHFRWFAREHYFPKNLRTIHNFDHLDTYTCYSSGYYYSSSTNSRLVSMVCVLCVAGTVEACGRLDHNREKSSDSSIPTTIAWILLLLLARSTYNKNKSFCAFSTRYYDSRTQQQQQQQEQQQEQHHSVRLDHPTL